MFEIRLHFRSWQIKLVPLNSSAQAMSKEGFCSPTPALNPNVSKELTLLFKALHNHQICITQIFRQNFFFPPTGQASSATGNTAVFK